MLDLVQGSAEWLAARAGSLGASQVADAIARTKTGWGASRANVMARLVAERLTGEPQESFTNAAMEWGREHEAEARENYEFMTDAVVEPVGLILHPSIEGTHASPDGLVGSDGLVEFKCPNTATHIETLISRTIPGKYVTQMQWQMACSGRQWCDFVSYDPRMPEAMRLFIQRVERDGPRIAELETLVAEFLAETGAKVAALKALYMPRAAA